MEDVKYRFLAGSCWSEGVKVQRALAASRKAALENVLLPSIHWEEK